MHALNYIKKFWNFLKADTWQSWIVSLVLLVIIIRFVLFPVAGWISGTPLPLVIVESCSMYHESGFDNWWAANGAWYESNNITKEEFKAFQSRNGLNKGDIILVWGRTEVKKGDIIIFEAGSKYPLIHRVVSEDPLSTKGDHNIDQLRHGNNPFNLDESYIRQNQVLGEAKLKVIPWLGWVKLIWFEPFKDPSLRGLCR